MRRLFWLFSFFALLAAGVAGAGVWWWVEQPLSWSKNEPLELAVEPGASASAIAQSITRAGVQVNAQWLSAWFRWSGAARQIKAGSYELEPGITPRALARKLVRGEEALVTITLLEGWTFKQVRAALAKQPQLKPDSQALSDEQIMERLGRRGLAPEGRFFPDTYAYARNSSDLALLARALRVMERQLSAAWSLRAADSVLQTPEQALILASIVEKETGLPSDRGRIAGVFHNRLRIGMLLQTDPTVIYGMGDAFDGNLRKVDLLTDTPWNTYTRKGLPPTPIAMPGKGALLAAVQPAATNALYFVARGDGSSQFSATLTEHNRAVNKYQRGGNP